MHRRPRSRSTAGHPRRLLGRTAVAAVGLTLLAATLTPIAAEAAGRSAAASASVTASRPELGARLLGRTQMRTRPGGRVVTTLGHFTEYGSQRVMAVVARRGRWLAVLSDHMPNSRAGWIPAADAALIDRRYRIDVDRSSRMLTVRRGDRVVRRVRVAVGAAATPTPTGRFAVTDDVRFGSGEYGGFALPITGHERSMPADRNRLAIHGTSAAGTVGTAASHGCLRAGAADMRWLIRFILPGTQVRIRA